MNEYFTLPTAIPPASLAKSSDVNTISDAVDTAFDNLPTDLGGLKNEIIEARLGKASLKISMADVVVYNNEQTVIATAQAGIATTQAALATTNGATQVNLAAGQVSLATTQANNAAASAQSALSAPGTSATSSTSVEIGTGLKTFTIQSGKSFVPGMTLKADSSGDWMLGSIVSYDTATGELVLMVSNIFGSGTLSPWSISISAPMPEIMGGVSVISFNNFI